MGSINEGFRDTNEITMSADVYTRSSSGGSSSSDDHSPHHRGKRNGVSGNRGTRADPEWQHLTRAKY